MPSQLTKTQWMKYILPTRNLKFCLTLEAPKLTIHCFIWHESSWRSNSASVSGLHQSEPFHTQPLPVIDKDPEKQRYSTQLPDMPRLACALISSQFFSPVTHRVTTLTEGCCISDNEKRYSDGFQLKCNRLVIRASIQRKIKEKRRPGVKIQLCMKQ